MVTALTNRALVELAEKDFLTPALDKGMVFKSSLSADEQRNRKLQGIQSFKSLSEQRPPLLLASYYVMSQIATSSMSGEHFDYIIIEEASQAFLSTIAIAKKLGKKCIIIGDIKQLEPIFRKEFPPDDPDNFHYMVCGLKAVSYYFPDSNQYILTDSYRLNERSAQATNSFYNDVLVSKSEHKFPLEFIDKKLANQFNKMGGTSINGDYCRNDR
jgi:superfamily I DNA and/or RNA helicase